MGAKLVYYGAVLLIGSICLGVDRPQAPVKGKKKPPAHKKDEVKREVRDYLLTTSAHEDCSPSYLDDIRYFREPKMTAFLEPLQKAETDKSRKLQSVLPKTEKEFEAAIDAVEKEKDWKKLFSQALYLYQAGYDGLNLKAKKRQNYLFDTLAAKALKLIEADKSIKKDDRKLLPIKQEKNVLKWVRSKAPDGKKGQKYVYKQGVGTAHYWDFTRWFDAPKRMSYAFSKLMPPNIFPKITEKDKGLAKWQQWVATKPKVDWDKLTYGQIIVLKEQILNQFDEESEHQLKKNKKSLKFQFAIPKDLKEEERVALRRYERYLSCKIIDTRELMSRIPLMSPLFPPATAASLMANKEREPPNILLSKDLRRIQDYLSNYHDLGKRARHGIPLTLRYYLQLGINHQKTLYNAFDTKAKEDIYIYIPLKDRIFDELGKFERAYNRKEPLRTKALKNLADSYFFEDPNTIPSIFYRSYSHLPKFAWEQILRRIDANDTRAKDLDRIDKERISKRHSEAKKLAYILLKNGRTLTADEYSDLLHLSRRGFRELSDIIYTLTNTPKDNKWWKIALKDGLSLLFRRPIGSRSNLLKHLVLPRINYRPGFGASLPPIRIESARDTLGLIDIDPKKLRYFEIDDSRYQKFYANGEVSFEDALPSPIKLKIIDYAIKEVGKLYRQWQVQLKPPPASVFKNRGQFFDYFGREYKKRTGEDLQALFCKQVPCDAKERAARPLPHEILAVSRMLHILRQAVKSGYVTERTKNKGGTTSLSLRNGAHLVLGSASFKSDDKEMEKLATRVIWNQLEVNRFKREFENKDLDPGVYKYQRKAAKTQLDRIEKEIRALTKKDRTPKIQKQLGWLSGMGKNHAATIASLDAQRFRDRVRPEGLPLEPEVNALSILSGMKFKLRTAADMLENNYNVKKAKLTFNDLVDMVFLLASGTKKDWEKYPFYAKNGAKHFNADIILDNQEDLRKKMVAEIKRRLKFADGGPNYTDIILNVPGPGDARTRISIERFPDDKLMSEAVYLDELEKRFMNDMIDGLSFTTRDGRFQKPVSEKKAKELREKMRNNEMGPDEYVKYQVYDGLRLTERGRDGRPNWDTIRPLLNTLMSALDRNRYRFLAKDEPKIRKLVGLAIWVNQNLKMEGYRMYRPEQIREFLRQYYTPHNIDDHLLRKRGISSKVSRPAEALQHMKSGKERRKKIRQLAYGSAEDRRIYRGLLSYFSNAPRGPHSRSAKILRELIGVSLPPHIAGGANSGRKSTATDEIYNLWERASNSFKISEWAKYEAGEARKFKSNAEVVQYLKDNELKEKAALKVGETRSLLDLEKQYQKKPRVGKPIWAHKYFEQEAIKLVLKPALEGKPEEAFKYFTSPNLPFTVIQDKYPTSKGKRAYLDTTRFPRIMGQARNYFLFNFLKARLMLEGKDLRAHFGPGKRVLLDNELAKLIEGKTEKERKQKLFLLAQGLYAIIAEIDRRLEQPLIDTGAVDTTAAAGNHKELVIRETEHLEGTLKQLPEDQFQTYRSHTDDLYIYSRFDTINRDWDMKTESSTASHIQLAGLTACDWFLRNQNSEEHPYRGLPLQSRVGIQNLPYLLKAYLIGLCKDPPALQADKDRLIDILYNPWPGRILNLVSSDKHNLKGGYRDRFRSMIDLLLWARIKDIRSKIYVRAPRLFGKGKKVNFEGLLRQEILGGNGEEEAEEYRRLLRLKGELQLPPPFNGKKGITSISGLLSGLISNMHRLPASEKEQFRDWILDALMESYPNIKELGEKSRSELIKELREAHKIPKDKFPFITTHSPGGSKTQFDGAGRFSREVLVILLALIDEGGDGESGGHASFLEDAKGGDIRFDPKYAASMAAKERKLFSKEKKTQSKWGHRPDAFDQYLAARRAGNLYFDKYQKDEKRKKGMDQLGMALHRNTPWRGTPYIDMRKVPELLVEGKQKDLQEHRKLIRDWVIRLEQQRFNDPRTAGRALASLTREGRKISKSYGLEQRKNKKHSKNTSHADWVPQTKDDFRLLALTRFRVKATPRESIFAAKSGASAAQVLLIYLIRAIDAKLHESDPKVAQKVVAAFESIRKQAQEFYNKFKDDKTKQQGMLRLGMLLAKLPWNGTPRMEPRRFLSKLKEGKKSKLEPMRAAAMYWLLQIEKNRLKPTHKVKPDELMEMLAKHGESKFKEEEEKAKLDKPDFAKDENYQFIAIRHSMRRKPYYKGIEDTYSSTRAAQIYLVALIDAMDERIASLDPKRTPDAIGDPEFTDKQKNMMKILTQLHDSKGGIKGLTSTQRLRLLNMSADSTKELLEFRKATHDHLKKKGLKGTEALWERLAQGGSSEEITKARSTLTPNHLQYSVLHERDAIKFKEAIREELMRTGEIGEENREKLYQLAEYQMLIKWAPERIKYIALRSRQKDFLSLEAATKKDRKRERAKTRIRIEKELRDDVARKQIAEYRKQLLQEYAEQIANDLNAKQKDKKKPKHKPTDPDILERAEVFVSSDMTELPKYIGTRSMTHLRRAFYKYRFQRIKEIALAMAIEESKKDEQDCSFCDVEEEKPKIPPEEFLYKATREADKELKGITELLDNDKLTEGLKAFTDKYVQDEFKRLKKELAKKAKPGTKLPDDKVILAMAKNRVSSALATTNQDIDFTDKHSAFLKRMNKLLGQDLLSNYLTALDTKVKDAEELLKSTQKNIIPKSYPPFLTKEVIPAIKAQIKKAQENPKHNMTPIEIMELAWVKIRDDDLFNYEGAFFPANLHDKNAEPDQHFYKNDMERAQSEVRDVLQKRARELTQLSAVNLCEAPMFKPPTGGKFNEDRTKVQVSKVFPFQGKLPLDTRSQMLACMKSIKTAIQEHSAHCVISGGKPTVSKTAKTGCVQRVWDNRVEKGPTLKVKTVKGDGKKDPKAPPKKAFGITTARGTWGYHISVSCTVAMPEKINPSAFSRYAAGSYETWQELQEHRKNIKIAPEEKKKWKEFLEEKRRTIQSQSDRFLALKKKFRVAIQERNTVARKINQSEKFKHEKDDEGNVIYNSKAFSVAQKERFEKNLVAMREDYKYRNGIVDQLYGEIRALQETFEREKKELESKEKQMQLDLDQVLNEAAKELKPESFDSLQQFSETYFEDHFRKLGIKTGKDADSIKSLQPYLGNLIENYIKWRKKGEFLIRTLAEENVDWEKDPRWLEYVKEAATCREGFHIDAKETKSNLQKLYESEKSRLAGLSAVLKKLEPWGITWNGESLNISQFKLPPGVDGTTKDGVSAENVLILLDELDKYLPLEGKLNPIFDAIGLTDGITARKLFENTFVQNWNAEGQPALFEWYDNSKYEDGAKDLKGVAVKVIRKGDKHEIRFFDLKHKRAEAQKLFDQLKEKFEKNVSLLEDFRKGENKAIPFLFTTENYHEKVEANLREIRKEMAQLKKFGNVKAKLEESGSGYLPSQTLAQQMGMQYKHEVVVDLQDTLDKIDNDRMWRNISWGVTAATFLVPPLLPLRGAGLVATALHGWQMGIGLHMMGGFMRQDVIPAFGGDMSEAYWSDLGPETLWSGATFAIGNSAAYGWGAWVNSGGKGLSLLTKAGREKAGWITRELARSDALTRGGATRLARFLSSATTQQMTSIFGTTVGLEFIKEFLNAHIYGYEMEFWSTLGGGSLHGAQNAFFMWGPDQRLAGWLGRGRWTRLFISVGTLQTISSVLNAYHLYERISGMEEQLEAAEKVNDKAQIKKLKAELDKLKGFAAKARFLAQQQLSELPTHIFFGTMAAKHGWVRRMQKDLAILGDPKADHTGVYERVVKQAEAASAGWWGFLRRGRSRSRTEGESGFPEGEQRDPNQPPPEVTLRGLLSQMPQYQVEAIWRESERRGAGSDAEKVMFAWADGIGMSRERIKVVMEEHIASEGYRPQTALASHVRAGSGNQGKRVAEIALAKARADLDRTNINRSADREKYLAESLRIEAAKSQFEHQEVRIGEYFRKKMPLQELLKRIDSQNEGRQAGEPLNLTPDQSTILQMASTHFGEKPTVVLNFLIHTYPRIPKKLRHWGKLEDGTGNTGLKEILERINPDNPRELNRALKDNSKWLHLEDVALIHHDPTAPAHEQVDLFQLAGRVAFIRDNRIVPREFQRDFENEVTVRWLNQENPPSFNEFYREYRKTLPPVNQVAP